MGTVNTNVDLAETLRRRRCELQDRLERVRRDLNHTAAPLSANFSEQALEVENDATLKEIGRTALEEIAHIDAALARVAAGKYGRCERCGCLIDAARLAARAESVTCAGCESK